MPNLTNLELQHLETEDMPSLLSAILIHCPNLKHLDFRASSEYTNIVGTSDSSKHDYFKDVAPLPKLETLNLGVPVLTGAESISKAFPIVEQVLVWMDRKEFFDALGRNKQQLKAYLSEHLPNAYVKVC